MGSIWTARSSGYVMPPGPRSGTPEVQVLLHTVLVSPRRDEVETLLAARLPGLSSQEAEESPYVLAGSPDTIAEKLLAQPARWGITHHTVRDDAMAAFAPILARISDQF